MFGIDLMSLSLPLAYLIVLSGALMTFSSVYRKRKAGTSCHLSWSPFPARKTNGLIERSLQPRRPTWLLGSVRTCNGMSISRYYT
jgi:Preprotein translocase subunit Sec66